MLILGIIVLVALCILVFLSIRHNFKKDNKVELELKDIISKCREITKKSDKGAIKFIPVKEEEYLYDILVDRKVMMKNSLGGYSFKDEYDRLWSKQNLNEGIASPVNYQDDDGVLQISKEIKDGKLITKIKKEVNGKVVELIEEDK